MNDLQILRYSRSERLILLKAAEMRKQSKFSRFEAGLIRGINKIKRLFK